MQPSHLTEAKALRPRARLNLPAAFSSYFTTRSIGWSFFFIQLHCIKECREKDQPLLFQNHSLNGQSSYRANHNILVTLEANRRNKTARKWYMYSLHVIKCTCITLNTACRFPKFHCAINSAAWTYVAVVEKKCMQILTTVRVWLYDCRAPKCPGLIIH